MAVFDMLQAIDIDQTKQNRIIILYICVLIRRKRGQPTLRASGRGLAASDKKKIAESAIVSTVVHFQTRQIVSAHYLAGKLHGIPPSEPGSWGLGGNKEPIMITSAGKS